jgi:hypothetical protein
VSATTVIVVKTPDKIILAADSLATHPFGQPPETVCKISKIGSIYFAFPGFSSVNFKVDPISGARRAAIGTRDMSEVAEAFRNNETAELSRAMPLMKNDSPDRYEIIRQVPLTAVFIGRNNGMLSWIIVAFSVSEPVGIPSVSSRIINCPGQCGDRVYRYGIIGEQFAIADAEKANPRLLEGNPEKIAASLIEIEIDKEPDLVGPPISELVLGNSGVRWIYPGACKGNPSQKNKSQ